MQMTLTCDHRAIDGADGARVPADARRARRAARARAVSGDASEVVVRRGGAQDVRFLRDMLHHAYYWKERAPDDGPGPGRALRQGLGAAGRHGRDRARRAASRSGPPGTGSSTASGPGTASSTSRRPSSRSRSSRTRAARASGARCSRRCSSARADDGLRGDLAQRRPRQRGRDRALRAVRLRAGRRGRRLAHDARATRVVSTDRACDESNEGTERNGSRRRRPRRRPGGLHGRDPRRAARRQGRLHRAGARARRHLPARRVHPDEGLGADRARAPRRARDVRQARRPGRRADARLRRGGRLEGRASSSR